MTIVLPRRRRLAGITRVLTASAVAGGAVVASTAVAGAEEEISVTVATFRAADFVNVAADLPLGLVDAVTRDLDIDAAEYLARAELAKSAADAVVDLRQAGIDVLGASLDGDEVTIHVDSEADAEAVAVAGATVQVGGYRTFRADRAVQPAADHKGGYGYGYVAGEASDGSDLLGRCSVGFSGYDVDGNPRFLTAGHCAEDPNTGEDYTSPIAHIDQSEPIWGSDGWIADFPDEPLGEFVPNSVHYGQSHDASLVDITNDTWTPVAQVAGWAGGAGDPDVGSVNILGTIEPVLGASVCKSGSTSGWTCGEIIAAQDDATVGDKDVSGFVFNACMLAGDSGGSVVVGSYALGINSGSSHENRTTCDTWVPATVDSESDDFSVGYAVQAGESNATDLYGDEWELAVSINTPSVTAPAEGAETGPTPTFTGTVTGAKSTHRVRVAIDGQQGYTVRIADDGSFSIPITEPLEPGEHTYVLRAAYGRHSVSEAVEGTFTSTEPQVEELVVTTPADGQTSTAPRPEFTGTGHPGATVTLTVDDEAFGSATVGDDGTWTLSPDADLPRGHRFDAIVTQRVDDTVGKVTIAGLGITVPRVTVDEPADGAAVGGDVVFAGTSHPGSTVTLSIDGVLRPAADGEAARSAWQGELEIDTDGTWTFAPDRPLPPGDYTVTATATVEGADPVLTNSEASVSFTVAESDRSLPDTGSSSMWLVYVGIGLLVVGGAALGLRAWRKRDSDQAQTP